MCAQDKVEGCSPNGQHGFLWGWRVVFSLINIFPNIFIHDM